MATDLNQAGLQTDLRFERGLANLTLVRADRDGPLIAISPDFESATGGWTVELAVRNFGDRSTRGPVEVVVLVDGSLAHAWVIAESIPPDHIVRGRVAIGPYPAGTHGIRVVIDPHDRVAESMKSDNAFETAFVVASAD